MKFILIGFIWMAIIGSVILYLGTREQPASHIGNESHPAETAYDIEILTSFKLELDPFTEGKNLSSNKKNGTSLLILLNGSETVRETATHEEMKPILFRKMVPLKAGKNEIYVEAFSSDKDIGKNLFLRLRLLEGRSVKFEKTFWSDGENSIRGTFIVDIPKKEE
jgi:hypothetical protein